MSNFYDRSGNPITMEEWARLLEDMAYRRVDSTRVGEVEVSTVWLGIDHGHGRRLLIFETMTFPNEDQERYSTEAEARAGHAAWVKRLREALP